MQILRAIFKWKVLPTSTLRFMLGQGENPKTFEKRVERLVHRGLLQRVEHIGVLKLLLLTEAGFLRFKNGLDCLKEDGFSSEAIWHDFLIVALQLGLWTGVKRQGIDFVTEQELRRFFKGDLPYWLPDCESHRPDGFTRFKNSDGICLMAFEVEISRKSADRYDPVARFYAINEGIDYVIWIVKNESHMQVIQERVNMTNDQKPDRHHFILFKDFQDRFWDAKFAGGQKRGHSIVELMSETSRMDVAQLSDVCRETVVSDFFKKIATG